MEPYRSNPNNLYIWPNNLETPALPKVPDDRSVTCQQEISQSQNICEQVQTAETFELKLLRSCIEKVIDGKNPNFRYTLREFITLEIYEGFCVHACLLASEHEKFLYAFNEFILLFNILNSNEYDQQKFDEHFKIFSTYMPQINKLFPLIAKNGNSLNLLDKPLSEILSKEPTKNCTVNILGMCNEYLSIFQFIGMHLVNMSHFNFGDNVVIETMENFLKNNSIKDFSKENRYKHSNSQALQLNAYKEVIKSIAIINESLNANSEQFFSFPVESPEIIDCLYAKLKKCNDFYFNLMIKIQTFSCNFFENNLTKWNNLNHDVSLIRNRKNKSNEIKDLLQHSEKVYQVRSQQTELVKNPGKFLETLHRINLNLFQRYSSLRGDISNSEIHQNMAWLMFGDEINEKEEVSTKELPMGNKLENKIEINPQRVDTIQPAEDSIQLASATNTIKSSKIQQLNDSKMTKDVVSISMKNSQKIFPEHKKHEQILFQNSQFIGELTKVIKKQLSLECLEGKLTGNNLLRAKLHSKECRDHLLYASLNLNLFCQAILSKDLYAIGAIVPFLCLDLHLTLEQFIKHKIDLHKIPSATSHNLAELCSYISFNMSLEVESFIQNFSNAMLQVRYPAAWKEKTQTMTLSCPLKWILYSEELCKIINSEPEYKNRMVESTDLINLCVFVLESYQKTLQCLLEQLPSDEKMSLSASKMSEEFKNLKDILESSLSNKKENFANEAIKIRNSHSVPISKNPILNSRQTLLLKGVQMPNDIDQQSATQVLTEAANHLIRIDAVDYLQKKYDGLQYVALHHRNVLMFPWAYEKIYELQAFIMKLGDLRYVSVHDLLTYNALVFPDQSPLQTLSEFNFKRNFHYTHEQGTGKDLPMISDLRNALKMVKKVDTFSGWKIVKGNLGQTSNSRNDEQTMKNKRVKIVDKGTTLLVHFINLLKENHSQRK